MCAAIFSFLYKYLILVPFGLLAGLLRRKEKEDEKKNANKKTKKVEPNVISGTKKGLKIRTKLGFLTIF